MKPINRKCRWCKRQYDARTESSIWCEDNPHRGRGANRRPKRIFRTLVLVR